jgi:ATP synthase protein I
MDDRQAPDSSKQPGGENGKGIEAAPSAMGVGMQIGLELVVSVAVCAGLGWLVDRGLGTKPWGVVIGFFLGVAVGIWTVYRAVFGQGMGGK